MKHFRRIYRVCTVVVYTISSVAVYCIGLLPVLIIGRSHLLWRSWVLRVWAKGTARLIQLEIRIIGTPPEPPFFLVSNHLSYIDIIPLYANLSCTFIAKQDVRSWPLLGLIARIMGVIFVDRGRKRDVTRVNRIVSKSLNRYLGIVLFPEGTTSDGSGVDRFRPSLLEHPAAIGMPVHFAAIHYQTAPADPPAGETVCWQGGISFPAHISRLLTLRRITCSLTFGSGSVVDSDRKILAEKLHKRVMEQFEPSE